MSVFRSGLAVVAMLAGVCLHSVPARAAAAEIGRLRATAPVAVAVDPSIHSMYVAEHNGSIRIYDTRTYASRSVELTCCLTHVVADPVTHRVYVSGNGLVVLDGVSGVVLDTISLAPGAPDALALDSAGGRAFVANPPGDSVAIVTTATDEVATVLPVRDRPVALAFDEATGILYVASGGESKIDAVDAATGTVLASANVAQPAAIAIGGGEIYVASGDGTVRVLEAASLSAVRTVAVGAAPASVAYNATSRRLWVSNRGSGTVSFVDTVTGTVLGTMPSGGRPSGVAFDAGLGRTYVAVRDDDVVQLLHESAATLIIGSPGEGGMVGPSKRTILGTAPPGAPVTIFEGTTAIGTGVADSSGAFAVSTALGEGVHTVVAAMPYEPYSAPRTFTVDLTPPAIELVSRTPAAASGWNRTPVHLAWRCTDALSGVKNERIEKVLGFDGRDQSTSATCEDVTGNKTTHTVTGINIDQRGPVIGMVRAPAATAGWNRTVPVTVSFSCVDTLSGMTGPVSHGETVAAPTNGRAVSFECRDVAGNVSIRTEIVRADLTAPTAVPEDDVPAATRVPVELDHIARTGITGRADDAGSGPTGAEVRFTSEAGFETVVAAPCSSGCGEGTIRWRVRPPPDLEAGWYEVSARASDLAGNVGAWSAPIRVVIATGEEWPRIPLPNLPI